MSLSYIYGTMILFGTGLGSGLFADSAKRFPGQYWHTNHKPIVTHYVVIELGAHLFRYLYIASRWGVKNWDNLKKYNNWDMLSNNNYLSSFSYCIGCTSWRLSMLTNNGKVFHENDDDPGNSKLCGT